MSSWNGAIALTLGIRHAHQVQSYNTISHDMLRPTFAKTIKYQGSFRIIGARTYNTLPGNIRQTETFSEFKIKLKRYILDNNCTCRLQMRVKPIMVISKYI